METITPGARFVDFDPSETYAEFRQTGLFQTDGADPETLSRLTDIGIGFENNGKMVVEDEDLLNDALSTRPRKLLHFSEVKIRLLQR